MGIYYPSFDGLKQFHMCNNKCVTIHFSYGYKHIHHYTDEENDGIEQSIDDYIERQIDERIFTEAK